jgi:hypothetical protein
MACLPSRPERLIVRLWPVDGRARWQWAPDGRVCSRSADETTEVATPARHPTVRTAWHCCMAVSGWQLANSDGQLRGSWTRETSKPTLVCFLRERVPVDRECQVVKGRKRPSHHIHQHAINNSHLSSCVRCKCRLGRVAVNGETHNPMLLHAQHMRQCAALRKSSQQQWTLLAVTRGAGAGAMIPILREMQAGLVSSESAGQYCTVINLQHVHAQRSMYSLRANLRRTRPMPLLEVETVTPSGSCAAARLQRPLSNRQPVLGGRRSYYNSVFDRLCQESVGTRLDSDLNHV